MIKKSYKILDKRYKIAYHDTSDLGECNMEKKVISISKSQKGLDKQKTLVHELLHGLFHELKLNLEDGYEEMIVRHLEEHVVEKWFKDLFKNNS